MSAGVSIPIRQDHQKMVEIEELIKNARTLPQPEDYFGGLDWGGEILPRKIVSFCRVAQNHRTRGWDGISAKAGRYDQHSRFVLIVALQGAGKMGVETSTRQIREGEVHLLFPHQIHYYVDLPDDFTWLFVTFELEAPCRELLESWRSGGRLLDEESREFLTKFLAEYHAGDGLRTSMALGRVLASLEHAVVTVDEPEPDADLVARIKTHVMEHLDGDLAMPTLSKVMDVSESYLRAVFREQTGVSLGNFVRSVRLVRATYLLEQGELDLGRIAAETGFGSLTSFTRAFRRMYEMTPSSYRKQTRHPD